MTLGRVLLAFAAITVVIAFLANTAPKPPGAAGSSVASSGTVTSPTTAAPTCSTRNFEVQKLRAWIEYDYVHLTGVVHNGCSIAAGVKLKWTAEFADGSVAFSTDFWPASTTNIAPRSDYPFETLNRAPRGKWTYVVTAEALTAW